MVFLTDTDYRFPSFPPPLNVPRLCPPSRLLFPAGLVVARQVSNPCCYSEPNLVKACTYLLSSYPVIKDAFSWICTPAPTRFTDSRSWSESLRLLITPVSKVDPGSCYWPCPSGLPVSPWLCHLCIQARHHHYSLCLFCTQLRRRLWLRTLRRRRPRRALAKSPCGDTYREGGDGVVFSRVR